MSRNIFCSVLLVTCLCDGGCGGSGGILIPYVSIPARIEIGGLSAHGKTPLSATGESETANLFHFRVGLHPLQGFTSLHQRSWDFGFGYQAQSLWAKDADSLTTHGFHLEGAYFPWAAPLDKNSLRLCLLGSAEVILTDFGEQAELGPGASLGAFIEWTGAAAHAYANSTGGGLGSSAVSVGAVYGEWSIGAGVTAGYRRLFDQDYYTLILALSFRLPFGAGLAGISG